MIQIHKRMRDSEARSLSLLQSVDSLLAALPGGPGYGESAAQWLEKYDAIAKQLHALGDELGGGSLATVMQHWVVYPIHPASANGQPSQAVPTLLRTKLDLEQDRSDDALPRGNIDMLDAYNASCDRLAESIRSSTSLQALTDSISATRQKLMQEDDDTGASARSANRGFALLRFMNTGSKEGALTERVGNDPNKCKNCGDDQHPTDECPSPPVCHSCGKPNHTREHCPDSIRTQRDRVSL